MRIIIELDAGPERLESIVTQAPSDTETGALVEEPLDGGSPAQELLQLISVAGDEQIATVESEGVFDAGPPPEELVAAIGDSPVAAEEAVSEDADAGSAPDEDM